MTRTSQDNAEKLRGGYYTLPSVADWLCKWAIRTRNDRILEPSCGDGAFLVGAADRLAALGTNDDGDVGQITGIELSQGEAAKCRARLEALSQNGNRSKVITGDFFEWLRGSPGERFDCVVGNPPFIRYQNFPEPCRTLAMDMMASCGLRPNRLTNTWVPFVVGAVEALKPGGRLAMVLPAELLQVSYAAQLRSFLADRFDSMEIITCNELFFENAQQEVVLLLADGRVECPSPANSCRIGMRTAGTVAEMLSFRTDATRRSGRGKFVRHDSEKWLKYFLSAKEIVFMRELRASPAVSCLSRHAAVDVGVVTGNNSFFVLTMQEANALGVAEYAIPLIGRSSQLSGAAIKADEWGELAARGERVFLFHVNGQHNGNLTPAARAYVESGEASGINKTYKCSIRNPWYTVPAVWAPDCLLFRQIYDFPRIVANKARAVSTDTIHRVTCKSNVEKLVSNTYTHLTAASAEIEGRSYGGGVLELEPTEAEHVLAPLELQAGMPVDEIDKLIRQGRLAQVLEKNDHLILVKGLGLSRADCLLLRRIWTKMRDRRHSRRKNGDQVGR